MSKLQHFVAFNIYNSIPLAYLKRMSGFLNENWIQIHISNWLPVLQSAHEPI